MRVVFTSYGNDSVALIQWMWEHALDEVHTVYSDTGWARKGWLERVTQCENWVRSLGYTPHQTQSIGMRQLVIRRKGWPMQGSQFCTGVLKLEPGLAKLNEIDPGQKAVCLVGVRREESANRRNYPLRNVGSLAHGGRTCYAPLADVGQEERNGLIRRAGFEPLPHRSEECFPCVNSNREDIRRLDENRIAEIEKFESELGFTSKGKPRTMFRPHRYQGACGIREIKRWADSERGKFNLDDGTGGPLSKESSGNCDGGVCGL